MPLISISEPPLSIVADGVRVAIRLTPRARTARLDGIAGGRLRVAVTVPPAENQANRALLRLLAREWRLPQRSLTIVAGAKSRDKVVHVAGDPRQLLSRLTRAIAAASGA